MHHMTSMTNQSFGQSIIALRKKQKLTQENLAKRIGVHRSFISGIEKGERNITLATIVKLAKAFEVEPVELFTSSMIELSTQVAETVVPQPVTFLKIGGTWDMIATPQGFKGSGKLDDTAVEELEKSVDHNEFELMKILEKKWSEVQPIQEGLGAHLFWAKGIQKIISGPFFPLFSGDSSHLRAAYMAPLLAYILKTFQDAPTRPIIAGFGTDTTDIFLGLLDPLLFGSGYAPFLLTGANRSYREAHSDAPQNFSDAAQAARMHLPAGAYYIFNNFIYRGSDMVKIDPHEDPQSLEGMVTFFSPHRTQKNLKNDTLKSMAKAQIESSSWSASQINTALQQIVTLDLGHANPIELEVKKLEDPSFKAVIIAAHALGNASLPIRRAVLKAVRENKLVMVVSRCLIGETSDRYSASLTSVNTRELVDEKVLLINGKKLGVFAARGILLRALLEEKNQAQTQEFVDKYSVALGFT